MSTAIFKILGTDVAPGVSEVQEGFTSLQSTLTTVLIPALVGIAIIGVVVVLGVKYLRKAGRGA